MAPRQHDAGSRNDADVADRRTNKPPGRRAGKAARLMFCAAVVAGCATERPLDQPGDDSIPNPADVDVDRIRARLDRDGNGAFDVELLVGPFPFSHSQDIPPHLKAAGVESLHGRLSFGTGTTVTIPAGHPVDPFLDVLLSDEAMEAHGLLVVVHAADAANLAPVGDVLARAAPPSSTEPGQTVTLDGSASLSFVEGQELAHQWSQAGGEPVELIDANTASATFVAPEVAGEDTLTFRLTVSSATDSDSVEVSVSVIAAEPGGGAPAADAAIGRAAYDENGCGVRYGDRAAALRQCLANDAEQSPTALSE